MKPGFRYTLLVLVPIGTALLLLHRVAARERGSLGRSTSRPLNGWRRKQFSGQTSICNSFDDQGNVNPPFFIYYGINDAPAEGGFGYFAVNPWTGDVWALWGCHKLSTPALRKSQAAIRRHFGRNELKQYARPRRLKPECIVED